MTTIYEELKALNINLNPTVPDQRLIEINPNKFYIISVNSTKEETVYEFAKELGKMFNKGGALILRGEAEVNNYELQDLVFIRDRINHLINVIKKKNVVIKNRYQLLKENIEKES